MTNTLATPTWVTKEVGTYFVNSMTFIAHMNRQLSDEFTQAGAKVGNTVNYRLPQRFVATDGQALQEQALYDATVPVSLTNQKNVAFSWSSAQATTELDDIRTRYLMPAGAVLANAADVLAFQNVYRDVYNFQGTPGVTPSTTQLYLDAGVMLTDASTPIQDRVIVMDPLAMSRIANTTTTLFNPQGKISSNYSNGLMAAGQLGIAEWYQDQNRPVHTTGSTGSSTPIVNNAGQTGSSITTTGWASLAGKRGDVVTFAGTYSTNPISGQSTGRLQRFVFTADVTDSGGAATLPISPPIITSGALQTVTNSPAANAIVLLWANTGATYTQAATVSPQSLLFHPDAFAYVTADLAEVNDGATCTRVRSKDYGYSLRMVQQYQIGTDQNPSRIDILIGAATLQARLAARIVG